MPVSLLGSSHTPMEGTGWFFKQAQFPQSLNSSRVEREVSKNPELTMEQVCSGLNQMCEEWQESQRGTSRRQRRLDTIGYHQGRNRAARESRQKRYGQGRRRHKATRGGN